MMKQFKKTSILFLPLLVFLLGACQFSETPEGNYADYKETAVSGLIEKGWIPDWLPQTAVNIHEKHDLDTNASILFFEAGAEFSVPAECEPTSNPPAAAFEESWWPQSVEASWSLYECGDQYYLAVDTAEMDVCFWRP